MNTEEIESQLHRFRKKAEVLEPDASQRKALWKKVIEWSEEFLEDIDEDKGYIAPNPDADFRSLYRADGHAHSLDKLIQQLKEGLTPGINPASGGHLGYIPGGGIYTAALGDFLADITNRYAGVYFANPGAVTMENEMIRWMCRKMGYPDDALGNLTSGGSVANLIAICTARDKHQLGPDNMKRQCIYLTDQAHHSLHKSLRISGLEFAQWRIVPVDEYFRMDVNALRQQIEEDVSNGREPFLLLSNAGTTDTGAVDPLNILSDIAEEYGMWHHVDAAYGGFFKLVPETEALFDGIERSDSITIDPHKGLFLPYGLGAVLIKDTEAAMHTHRYTANYMQDAADATVEPSPADLSPELTKHFRGLRMWLPLQLHGEQPFIDCLEEKIWLCRYFYDRIRAFGFEVGPYPDLSVAIYRYIPEEGDPDEFNKKLLDFCHRDGAVFLSSTTIDGTYWLRVAILAFRTHKETIDRCLNMLNRGIQSLSS